MVTLATWIKSLRVGGEKDGKREDAEDGDDTVVCDGEWDEEIYDDNEDDHAMTLAL